jgi:phosphoribosylaminoimidazole-succinocarboxamide synthase
MAKIPERIKNASVIPSLKEHLVYQGKVRDTYKLPCGDENLLLLCATDRLSIFDFVLNALVPNKGEILTALTEFWLTEVLAEFPNHLMRSIAYPGKNYAFDLKEVFPDIPLNRCLAVEEVEIPPYEMIFRHHLGGSIFKKYEETGMAGGQKLPQRLPRWSFLDQPLFTPSTKSKDSHDVNISASDYYEAIGEKGRESVKMFKDAYKKAYAFAREKGILILDTKFEGLNIIADEALTPDSSRFTTVEDWTKAMEEKRDPIFYDKEVVRQWGKTVKTPFGATGIHMLWPKNPEHVAFVHGLEVPAEIIEETSGRYFSIFYRLTGQKK